MNKQNPYDQLLKPWIYGRDDSKRTVKVKQGYKNQGKILLKLLHDKHPTQQFNTYSIYE